ncbi:MAG: MATE family efflux transporter [Bilifractor sp.]
MAVSGSESIRRKTGKGGFLVHDRNFYATVFSLMVYLILRNIVTYSVNVADNVMLGAYSQTDLSAAAAVNQIQYILQQVTVMGLGEGVTVLAGQYWGKRDADAVQRTCGMALRIGLWTGVALTAAAFLIPAQMIRIFSSDPAIVREGVAYLRIIRYTYILFIISNLLLAALRSIQVVQIAFNVSVLALIVNVSINYMLIFGKFGAPEMGITGAAIGTLIARGVELSAILIYMAKSRKMPFRFQLSRVFQKDRRLFRSYVNASVPCVVSAIFFAGAVAVQTAIFGHMNSDALAASSVAGTFFQFTKMIPSGAASAAAVVIAQTVGSGQHDQLKTMVRTLQIIFVVLGVITGMLLFLIRTPALSFYDLTDRAYQYAMQQMLVQALVSVAMSYEMPSQVGIIRPGGDPKYTMISDFIYSWLVVVPLSLLAAFVWHMSFAWVVFFLNIDQFLKVLTVGWKVNSYTWLRQLT